MNTSISISNHQTSVNSSVMASVGNLAPSQDTNFFSLDFFIPGVLLNATGLLGLLGNVMSIMILR